MNSMQAAGALASGGGPSIHPDSFQLFQADQAVLPVGDPGDFQIPPPRSKTTGRTVGFSGATGWSVKATWTFRPVGGGRGGEGGGGLGHARSVADESARVVRTVWQFAAGIHKEA